MNTINGYRELIVWQKAITLCRVIYHIVKSFPAEERFALSDQLRRAVVSVPSNIAEGNGRASKKDYAHFLSQARGSMNEVGTQLELAVLLGFIGNESQSVADATVLIDEIAKMLNTLIARLSSSHSALVPNP